MNTVNCDFSFRKTFSRVQQREYSTSSISLPKTLGISDINLNNTSRFE